VSYRLCIIGGMNLNRDQFLTAVERGSTLLKELKRDYPELKLKPVFSCSGPRSGQFLVTTDLRKIVMTFPEMLSGEIFNRERTQGTQDLAKSLWAESLLESNEIGTFRRLLIEITGAAEKDGDKEKVSRLWKQVNEVEGRLLDPDLPLYCGDIQIEYRPGTLNRESLRRLQQDPRLPQELNDVGSVRIVAGSLEMLAGETRGRKDRGRRTVFSQQAKAGIVGLERAKPFQPRRKSCRENLQ
jgi:hypothetical protein